MTTLALMNMVNPLWEWLLAPGLLIAFGYWLRPRIEYEIVREISEDDLFLESFQDYFGDRDDSEADPGMLWEMYHRSSEPYNWADDDD